MQNIEVNLSAFVYRLFHEDFSSLIRAKLTFVTHEICFFFYSEYCVTIFKHFSLRLLLCHHIAIEHSIPHPELSGYITTLTVVLQEVANFCAAMDTLIDQDVNIWIPFTHWYCHQNSFPFVNSPELFPQVALLQLTYSKMKLIH